MISDKIVRYESSDFDKLDDGIRGDVFARRNTEITWHSRSFHNVQCVLHVGRHIRVVRCPRDEKQKFHRNTVGADRW